MLNRDSTNDVVNILQTAGLEVSDQDRYEIQQYENGKSLSQLVHFPGWEVLVTMLKSYDEGATLQLLEQIPPGDTAVIAAHAAAFAVHDMVKKVLEDVNTAIEASHRLPNAMKRGVQAVKGMPIESF